MQTIENVCQVGRIDNNDEIYQELVKEKTPELFCEVCGHYPIEPVHGHFQCPKCRNVTKCCEGMPLDIE